MVHIAALEVRIAMPIHLFTALQVQKDPTFDALQKDKAPTKIPDKYFDYADVFSTDLAIELPENTGIKEHAIKLVEGKQPPYRPIYTPRFVELESLKAYIETYLKTGFIQPSKFHAGAPIVLNNKPNGSLYLCIDYRGLNNLTIKNQYAFPLIGEALDCLGRAKQFT